jgi:hypothetical protein
MAGYSGTPLPQKLGIKPGHRLLLAGAPEGFLDETLAPLPDGVTVLRSARPPVDVAVAFATTFAELRKRFAAAEAALAPNGGLWVAWPKRASGVPTELDENLIRDFGLDAGLVDNKVCAVDDIWSGLRFVIRLADRAARA